MEGLQVLEPLAFPLSGICLGDIDVIVCKREEVSLTFEADGHYWTYKIGVNVLVGFYYPLLGYLIVPLYGFCFFTAIADISFSIINKGDVVMGEVFLQ